MRERIRTPGYNPLTERERLEPFYRNTEPEEDDVISVGIFSQMPDTPWIGWSVANNGQHELRCVIRIPSHIIDLHKRGLMIIAEEPCKLEMWSIIGQTNETTTWNSRQKGSPWQAFDMVSQLIDHDVSDMTVTLGDGDQNLIVRRADIGPETIAVKLVCAQCEHRPCRCAELDAITDALEQRGVPVERDER